MSTSEGKKSRKYYFKRASPPSDSEKENEVVGRLSLSQKTPEKQHPHRQKKPAARGATRVLCDLANGGEFGADVWEAPFEPDKGREVFEQGTPSTAGEEEEAAAGKRK